MYLLFGVARRECSREVHRPTLLNAASFGGRPTELGRLHDTDAGSSTSDGSPASALAIGISRSHQDVGLWNVPF